MKFRLTVIFLILCMLSGCASPLVPSEYTVISEHSDTTLETQSDAVSAETYDELKYAILSFVEDGVTQGVIRSYNYDGDITKDISSAAYEVWKNDPMGAYAVEYMTTDCDLLLSYYESHVEITYRENTADADDIEYVRGRGGAEEAIAEALSNMEERLTLRISAYGDTVDCAAMVEAYCAANPETMMETPGVTVEIYPDEGTVRIAELQFDYAHTPTELTSMKMAVNAVLNSAATYVRYRNEDNARAEMLVSYLLGRFEYTEGTSSTPVYALLCEGVANSSTFARVFQVLCDRVGLSCRTVSGYLDGESYEWNILQIGEMYHHVDLMRYVREGRSDLIYYADSDMERYSWDRELYPACGIPEDTLENPVNETDTPEEPGEPDQGTPDEPERPGDPTVPEDTEISAPDGSGEQTDSPEPGETAPEANPEDISLGDTTEKP